MKAFNYAEDDVILEMEKTGEPFNCISAALKLMKKKSLDYNGTEDLSQIDLTKYNPFGIKSHVHMLNLKIQRLISLTNQEGTPQFESIEDSVIDLFNYVVMTMMYLKKVAEQND
jgi:hypothetical protein